MVQSWLPTLPAFAVLLNSSCPAQIFYAKNCRKAISVGDRVFNTRREEVAEVIGFDHMGAHQFVGTWGIINATVVPNVSCSETRQKMATHISSQCPSHAFLPHLWMWLCEVHT